MVLHRSFNDLKKGIIAITLYENMLNGNISPVKYLEILTKAIQIERNSLNIHLQLGYLSETYWKFLSNDTRQKVAKPLELLLWNKLTQTTNPGLKKDYFSCLMKIAVSPDSIEKLYNIWKKNEKIEGLIISEYDFTNLALELAIRQYKNPQMILDEMQSRISNEDRKKRLEYLKPVFSTDIKERDSFFNSLKDARKREKEPWIETALRYLNHPIYSAERTRYILPALNLLEEIQITGDIFFPKSWLDATLGGHNTEKAYSIVKQFIQEHPTYSINLKNKIIQSSDILSRSSKFKE